MKSVDLNCDLGEGCGNDAALMPLISSANVACGYHAGDEDTMRRTVELALEHGVAIGAHPGYDDRENFGRTSLELSPAEVEKIVSDQILKLKKVCGEFGARLRHVKPHGALYNQAAKDTELAGAIAEAVRRIDGDLVLFGLSGSEMISEASRKGLRTASEVFADRTYQPDGTLTPRTEQNALIEDDQESIEQVLQMVMEQQVTAINGDLVDLVTETICIHGDAERAVEFAARIRRNLEFRGISIRPPFV